MTRAELDRFTRADEQGGAGVEISEDSVGEGHGGERHRDRTRTDGGVCAHTLGHRERALEQLVEHHP